MTLRILHSSETLESLKQRLQEVSGRPVYLSGGITAPHPLGLYRFPGTEDFVPASALKLLLSSVSAILQRQTFIPGWRYVLYPANELQFLVPFKTKEAGELAKSWYDQINLPLFENLYVFLSEDTEVPEELQPFVHKRTRKSPSGKRELTPSIAFYRSHAVETPNIRQDHWFIDHIIPIPVRDETYVTLCPPGQYSGEPHRWSLRFNNLLMIDCNPGPCIVCHGRSGERKHLAHHDLRPQLDPVNHVCRACLQTSTQDWINLLNSWTP